MRIWKFLLRKTQPHAHEFHLNSGRETQWGRIRLIGKTMTANECYAYFGLSGPTLDPDAVTAALKLVPTEVERVGDLTRSGKKREEGAWQLNDRIPRDARIDFEARVKDVLEQLEPCFEAAASLCKRHHGMIMLVGYFNEYEPGLWLGADTVARIGRLGAAFHCDFYHLIEGP